MNKTIREFNKNENLTKENFEKISIELYKIKNSINLNTELNIFSKFQEKNITKLSDILEEYYMNKHEISKLNHLHKSYEKKAEALSKVVLYIGGLFFVVQLYLIYYFTFEVYSWDITEPMTYLMGCFNLFLIFYLKKRFKGSDPFTFFKTKFLNILIKRSGKIDFEKMEKLKINIREIERFMSK